MVDGLREFRLLDYQLQPGDVGTSLSDPRFDLHAGQIGILRTSDHALSAQGYVLVEFMYTSSGVAFDVL